MLTNGSIRTLLTSRLLPKTLYAKIMKKTLIASSLVMLCSFAHAEHVFVASIPVKCEETKSILSKFSVPENFKLNPYEALKIAVDAQPIIKLCASKLEQVIYRDENNYYFTNSVLFSSENQFPNRYVLVNAITGVVEDKF